MPSLREKEGYLLIDHRASPGVPADIARKWGAGEPHLLGEGKIFEAATQTCAHCSNVYMLNPERMRRRGYCNKCDQYICDKCDATRALPDYVHASQEKISDLILNDAAKGTGLGSSLILLNYPNFRKKGDSL